MLRTFFTSTSYMLIFCGIALAQEAYPTPGAFSTPKAEATPTATPGKTPEVQGTPAPISTRSAKPKKPINPEIVILLDNARRNVSWTEPGSLVGVVETSMDDIDALMDDILSPFDGLDPADLCPSCVCESCEEKIQDLLDFNENREPSKASCENVLDTCEYCVDFISSGMCSDWDSACGGHDLGESCD